MRTDQASASARSAARTAFLASARALSARIFAPLIALPQMTSRDLVLMIGDYSRLAARCNATRISGENTLLPPRLRQTRASSSTAFFSVCNLYSIATNQAAILRLFRVVNQYPGNLPP